MLSFFSSSLSKGSYLILLSTILFSVNDTFADIKERENLAKHYSPVIYQHIDTAEAVSLEGKSDLILPFDFDGDWSGDNNWKNLKNHIGPATIYYSVIETTNNWFIYYAIYHPRDWTNVNKYNDFGERSFKHENDMEAITLMVSKGNGYPGNLIAAMSMSHNVWLEYPIEKSVIAKHGDKDIFSKTGVSYFKPIKIITDFVHNGHHSRVYIQSRGHGVFLDKNGDLCLNAGNKMGINHWDKTGFPRRLEQYNGTGIVYYCSASDKGDVIARAWDKLIDSGKSHHGPADNYQDRWVKYQLTPLESLWEKRVWTEQNKISQHKTYIKENGSEAFYGPKYGSNEAHPPWSMPAYATCGCGKIPGTYCKNISDPGEILFNPLSAYLKHFNFDYSIIPKLINEKYLYNPYNTKPVVNTNCSNIKSDTPKPLATAIVFDHSGSMANERKIDYAREATFTFSPHMKQDDLLSVSIFSNDADTPAGLELKKRADILPALHSILPTIAPNGQTNIGAGLERGLEQLCTASGEKLKKGALLLSDGMNNVGSYDAVVQDYKKWQVPIYTVRFGSQASAENLRKIAENTGGVYMDSNQETVTGIYSRMYHHINGDSTIIASHDPMSPTGKLAYHVDVTPGADSLHVNTSWQGSRLKTVFSSPSGSTFSGDQLPGPADRFEKGPISQYTQILNPESGRWKLDISWDEPPTVTERVNLLVSEHTDVYTSILGFSPEYRAGEQVTINVHAAELDGGNNKIPLKSGRVKAKVRIPGPEVIRMIKAQSANFQIYNDVIQDVTREVDLFDDGQHNDYKSEDGIFGGFFTETQLNGSYIVTAYIEGRKAKGTPVSRRSTGTFQVGPLQEAEVTTSEIMQYVRQPTSSQTLENTGDPLESIDQLNGGDPLESIDSLMRSGG